MGVGRGQPSDAAIGGEGLPFDGGDGVVLEDDADVDPVRVGGGAKEGTDGGVDSGVTVGGYEDEYLWPG